jgi:NADH-quinone oxidoreductase subunit F
VRQEEALLRIARNRHDAAAKGREAGRDIGQDIHILRDVGLVMKDSSICGLGQAAWNAVESAIDRLGVLEKSR